MCCRQALSIAAHAKAPTWRVSTYSAALSKHVCRTEVQVRRALCSSTFITYGVLQLLSAPIRSINVTLCMRCEVHLGSGLADGTRHDA